MWPLRRIKLKTLLYYRYHSGFYSRQLLCYGGLINFLGLEGHGLEVFQGIWLALKEAIIETVILEGRKDLDQLIVYGDFVSLFTVFINKRRYWEAAFALEEA